MTLVALRDPVVLAGPRPGAARLTSSALSTASAAALPCVFSRGPRARVDRESPPFCPTTDAQERTTDPRG